MLKGMNKELNDFFEHQLSAWNLAQVNYEKLRGVKTRRINCNNNTVKLQFNPARMLSASASIDEAFIASRPCFLCKNNRPEEQNVFPFDSKFDVLVNPFPILPIHFTIAAKQHQPQNIIGNYGTIHNILSQYEDLTVFYNGPKCGASAPDHLHFQAGTSGVLPLQAKWQQYDEHLEEIVYLNEKEGIFLLKDYICPAFVIKSCSEASDIQMFHLIYNALPVGDDDTEPMVNIVSWRQNDDYLSVIFPRVKHRPDCYYAPPATQILISPGALDMAGLVITPRGEDYHQLSANQLDAIINEVAMSPRNCKHVVARLKDEYAKVKDKLSKKVNAEQPNVEVGIVSAKHIEFTLNDTYIYNNVAFKGNQTVEIYDGKILFHNTLSKEISFNAQSLDASFTLNEVTIGIDFHWERQENQTFFGAIKFVVDGDKLLAINTLPVETYLASVISSEMSASASLQLLKAHAVISRSWLLYQMNQRDENVDNRAESMQAEGGDDEIIRWYDRDSHALFDVCADDHCQRYQGITKQTKELVVTAVAETMGEVLMFDGEICDARFSKCCGGVSEEYQYCWENITKPYLKTVRDVAKNEVEEVLPDLTNEAEAKKWICSTPDAFCNNQEKHVLSQVLNDYDMETNDFYRWRVEYTQAELSALINSNLGMDFGDILDLVPLERGKSGRISRLRIVGSERTIIIGKELEIRKTLSKTHLYSSAFVVDRRLKMHGVPQQFILIGAGWGHGVGLCQIGAAVMGEQGYDYKKILSHYYSDATIQRIYKK